MRNPKKCDEEQTVEATGAMNKKGSCGMLWYHPEGIANILSLHNVQKKYKVTYDSSLMTVFVVQKSDDTQHMFKP